MRSLKLALLATAATAVLSSAAFAADLIVDQPTAPPMVDNSFNWDGAYIGALIQGQTAPNAFAIGADLGVNTTMSGLLLGGEIEATVGIPTTASVQATGAPHQAHPPSRSARAIFCARVNPRLSRPQSRIALSPPASASV